MSRTDRLTLIRKIEETRGSTVICYLTSLRPNVPSQMSDDAVRVMFDHLLRLPSRPVPKLDIFLCSNGGSGTVPWRLVSLFREFSKSFAVLVPYRAYSAASLLALGADEIVMHPFGELGPIDPTVSNDFNPIEHGRRVGINVEDVRAYVNFIKTGAGITHEDELVKAVEILANKVHPLALGNVERFLSQSRMIAAKILRTHMKEADEHVVSEIVENMASKLYFHGHPINRQEAKNDLKLKVNMDLPPELETAMWGLYCHYEDEFQSQSTFNPAADLADMPDPEPGPKVKEYELLHAVVECTALNDRFLTRRRFQQLQGAQPGQVSIREEVLSQGWTREAEPEAETPSPPSETNPADAPKPRRPRAGR
ncbi:MAG: hypothetical protein KJZ78_13810 [Bryobacteraceae bacterium]|nr:hypothetical protein [Bryobacteraceae bacterium]